MLRIWIEYNFDGWNSPYTIHKTSVVYPGLRGFLTSFPSNSSLLPLCSSILFEEKSNENLGPGYQSSQSYVPHTLFTSQLISTSWYLLSVWCSFWWIGGTPLRKCFSSENCLYCLIGRQSTSQRNGESIHDDEKKKYYFYCYLIMVVVFRLATAAGPFLDSCREHIKAIVWATS